MLATALLLIWQLIYSIFFLPVLVMPNSVRVKSIVMATKVLLYILRVTTGITYEVRGILPPKGCIIASKHQSALETFILITIIKNPIFILKKELAWFPFIGLHLLNLKMIFIDRKGGAKSVRKMLNAAKSRIKEGKSIIIFPEGSRIPVGKTAKYQPGIAILYKFLAVPVIPIAVNTGHFFTKDINNMRPGKAIIEILPPIAPNLGKEEFLKTLQLTIEQKSNELLQESLSETCNI